MEDKLKVEKEDLKKRIRGKNVTLMLTTSVITEEDMSLT